jgi:hypothetical protein
VSGGVRRYVTTDRLDIGKTELWCGRAGGEMSNGEESHFGGDGTESHRPCGFASVARGGGEDAGPSMIGGDEGHRTGVCAVFCAHFGQKALSESSALTIGEIDGHRAGV